MDELQVCKLRVMHRQYIEQLDSRLIYNSHANMQCFEPLRFFCHLPKRKCLHFIIFKVHNIYLSLLSHKSVNIAV